MNLDEQCDLIKWQHDKSTTVPWCNGCNVFLTTDLSGTVARTAGSWQTTEVVFFCSHSFTDSSMTILIKAQANYLRAAMILSMELLTFFFILFTENVHRLRVFGFVRQDNNSIFFINYIFILIKVYCVIQCNYYYFIFFKIRNVLK